MVKGFYQTSRAWYGEADLEEAGIVDEVRFGLYNLDDGKYEEVCVIWEDACGTLISEMTVFGDSWGVLAEFNGLIKLMSIYNLEKSITPDEFCELLLEAGCIDRTETVSTEPIETILDAGSGVSSIFIGTVAFIAIIILVALFLLS